MKKLLHLSIFIFISTLGMSQSILDSIQVKIAHKLSLLSPASVPTGILYERILPKAQLIEYSGVGSSGGLFLQGKKPSGPFTLPGSSVPLSDMYHFFLALDDLERADYLNRYAGTEQLFLTNKNSRGPVNVGIINADISIFHQDPLSTGALVITGSDSLLQVNTSSNVPVYETKSNCFVASPLRKRVIQGQVSFHINPSFWKETAQLTISTLRIDFGDGTGFRTLSSGQTTIVYYATSGTKEVKFEATLSNNSKHFVNSSIEVMDAPISAFQNTLEDLSNGQSQVCATPISQTFLSSRNFQGYDETQAYPGCGRYFNHSNSPCIDNPVIVVDGFDLDGSIDNQTLYNSFLNRNNLGTQLRFGDFDVFTLDFLNHTTTDGTFIQGGADYIERNAMVLVDLIEYINTVRTGNSTPIKVVGFSMGGLVARYALRYMELNGIAHQTDLYVSVDAPHQGATLPAGAQHAIDFIDDVVPGWIDDEANRLADGLFLPAVKQMLVYHLGGTSEHPDGYVGFHDRFYNTLNTMGYPQQTRNVATVNGRLDGIGTNSFGERFFKGKVDVAGGILARGKADANFTINNGRNRVFYWRLRFLIFNVWKVENHAQTYANIGSHENAPGGVNNVANLGGLDFNLEGDFVIGGFKFTPLVDNLSFISTKSALDYIGNPYLYEHIGNRNLVCTNNTPFDSYYAPLVNEEHINLSIRASQFIRQEILGNPQEPTFVVEDQDLKRDGGAPACGNLGNSIRLYFEPCQEKAGTTWLVSDPSKIIILQQDITQFRFKAAPNAGGTVTITAVIPNQANISRTIRLGPVFDFPAGSYYIIDTGTDVFNESLNLGGNNSLPGSPSTFLVFPHAVSAEQKLPPGWHNAVWSLDSDNGNAVFSWAQYQNRLHLNYLPSQHNAIMHFKLHVKDNCGIQRFFSYYFVVSNGPSFRKETTVTAESNYGVYPNPANESLTIVTESFKDESVKATVEVYDMLGALVLQQELNSTSEKVNTSTLLNGVYLVKINQDGKFFTERVVIEH